jgi:hypothetical protein
MFGWAYSEDVADATMKGALIGAFSGAWGYYLGSSRGAHVADRERQQGTRSGYVQRAEQTPQLRSSPERRRRRRNAMIPTALIARFGPTIAKVIFWGSIGRAGRLDAGHQPVQYDRAARPRSSCPRARRAPRSPQDPMPSRRSATACRRTLPATEPSWRRKMRSIMRPMLAASLLLAVAGCAGSPVIVAARVHALS